ncbi:alpha/beta fold hydrolase [Pseudonocardia humida]|uniref:Alpha/beta hydrolase n=1 Tax=Pseudonocardia humida TaxID=2800819 RepID=A0ABT1A3W0_9PSEU|nr:alpha/beta hydrolase [Pseudonocardia humida]MCO1657675.1 alpha/beta hydrolase [Pseudonocardia humida]
MQTIRSADGTRIAYDRAGEGPPVVLAVGAFCDRHVVDPLAALLARERTVLWYDRRGRGDSDPAAAGPDAVEREVEDLAAVVAAAGPGTALYGHSSGAILALAAAARGVPVDRVVAYEPPWAVDDTASDPALEPRVRAALADGRPDDAVRLFIGGSTAPLGFEDTPAWAGMRALAPTLPFDFALAGPVGLPAWLADVAVPVLVLDGGESEAWARDTVAAVARAVPGARHRTLAGQGHGVDHDAVAPVIAEFLAG